MRSRYYQVEIGRFITADSYEGNKLNILSQNRYTYVEGNPINYIDPLGLHPATRQYDKFGNYKTKYNTGIVNIGGRNVPEEYAILTSIALKQSTLKPEKVVAQGYRSTSCRFHRRIWRKTWSKCNRDRHSTRCK